jgi:hypothetical protein
MYRKKKFGIGSLLIIKIHIRLPGIKDFVAL